LLSPLLSRSPPFPYTTLFRSCDGVYTWPQVVADLIERFTYAGIFLVLFVAGLGVPIPEEAPILAAGVLASQDVIRWWLGLAVCLDRKSTRLNSSHEWISYAVF